MDSFQGVRSDASPHDGVEIMELKISFDERVEDGLYGAISMLSPLPFRTS